MTNILQIPQYPDLEISESGRVFNTKTGKQYTINYSFSLGNHINHKGHKVSVSKLRDLAISARPLRLGEKKYNLTREGVLRLVAHMTGVERINASPVNGVYETSDRMISLGIHQCPDCGVLMPLEVIWCKCGDLVIH